MFIGLKHISLEVKNAWFSGAALINTYTIEELMATKLRALYQRKKGRDLFDFYAVIKEIGLDSKQMLDCFKSYMQQQDVREKLVLNNEFARFATYAGFNIRACEGYDPQSKGKVEAGVKFVENNGFYGEEFANWSELQRYTLEWLDTIANLRVHGTTKQIPQVLFDNEEKACLKSYQLSNYTYNYSQHITRKVDKTGLISWSGNKYPVPMAYQQSSVYVHEEDDVLIIF